MSEPEPQFLAVGRDKTARRIACLPAPGGAPGVVWLPGFHSLMTSTKAAALARWAAARGTASLRFDYSGHGRSSGAPGSGTVGLWLEEAIAVIRAFARGPQILVGSSMGGWLALLILRSLVRGNRGADGLPPVAGAVLIAPAWDMTEELFWKAFPDEVKTQIERDGAFERPSRYEGGPYVITRELIEEGRNHLIAGTPFDPGCPVRIIHGLKDPDVPWRHTERLSELLRGGDVETTYVPDGEHRLSRDKDIALMLGLIERLADRALTAPP